MISVAMTSYNGEKYIEKQLNSLLNQTIQPDEVVIVDDFSTDKTREIIESFIEENNLDSKWRLIVLDRNYGHLYSFYKSISEVNGDYIFLCDQDDIWLSGKVETMVNVMQRNPSIMALSSSFLKIDENDKPIKSKNKFFSSNSNLIRQRIKKNDCIEIDSLAVITYNISPGCTMAFKSNIKEVYLKQVGLSDEVALVHDWKINLIAATQNGLYFLNTPTILYRLHSQNTLGLTRASSILERIDGYKKAVLERKYMWNILMNTNIDDKEISIHTFNYIKKMDDSYAARISALNKKSIWECFYIIFKYNLFKKRAYESVLLDIVLIIKSRLASSEKSGQE